MKLIRYTERPDLWANSLEISHEVWPEYNQHGEVVSKNWGRLFEEFPAHEAGRPPLRCVPWPPRSARGSSSRDRAMQADATS